MSYVIIDKTRFANYGWDKEGESLYCHYLLPKPQDNEAHTYETLESAMEYIISLIEEGSAQGLSDFAIAEIKEMSHSHLYDMVQSYLQDKDNES